MICDLQSAQMDMLSREVSQRACTTVFLTFEISLTRPTSSDIALFALMTICLVLEIMGSILSTVPHKAHLLPAPGQEYHDVSRIQYHQLSHPTRRDPTIPQPVAHTFSQPIYCTLDARSLTICSSSPGRNALNESLWSLWLSPRRFASRLRPCATCNTTKTQVMHITQVGMCTRTWDPNVLMRVNA